MENRSISKKIKHLHLTIYILANNLFHKIIYSKNKRFNKQLYNILFVLGLKRPILYKMDHIYDKSENIPQQWKDLPSLQLPALLGGRRIVSPAKKNGFLLLINPRFSLWRSNCQTEGLLAAGQKNIINIEARRFVTASFLWFWLPRHNQNRQMVDLSAKSSICHGNKLAIYKPNSAFGSVAGGYSAAEDLSAKSLICQNASSTTQNRLRNIQKKTALIEKFINHIMINGKRSTALNILYTALQLLVCKSEIYKNKASPQEGVSTNYKGSGIKSPLPHTLIKTPFSSIFCFTSLVQIRDLDPMTRISKPQILSSLGAPCSVSKINLPQKKLLFNINQYSKRLILNRYKNNIFVNNNKKPEKQINKIDQCSFPHKKVSYNTNLYGMVVTNEKFGRVALLPNLRFVGEPVIHGRFRNDLPQKKTSRISISSYKKQMIANLLQPKKRKGFFTGKAIYKFISKKLWERSVADKSSISPAALQAPNKSSICHTNKLAIYEPAPLGSCFATGYGTEDLLETGPQGEKNRRFIIEELLFSENNSSSIMVETDISDISQSQKMSIDLIQKAIENVKPWIEVRKVKKRGIVYLVPAFVQPHRQETLAIRWILEAARKRKKNRSTFLRGGINQHGSYNLKYDLIESEYKGSELTKPWKTLHGSHKTNPILQRQENRIPKLVNIGQNPFINDSNTKLCSFFESLAAELFDASKKQGKARQKRDEMHKVSLASRVNLRFRWWKR